jgi:hypothetical protein
MGILMSVYHDPERLIEPEMFGRAEELLSSPPEGCAPFRIPRKDHDFDVGYWFSSWNANGLENLLERHLGWSVSSFLGYEATSGETWLAPVWENLLPALRGARELIQFTAEDSGRDVLSIPHTNPPQKSVQELLKESIKEAQEAEQGAFQRKMYSVDIQNKDIVRVEVAGQGTESWTYIHYIRTDWSWYLRGLEIIEETCTCVLRQAQPEEYIIRATNVILP